MEELDNVFEVEVTEDKMKAVLKQIQKLDQDILYSDLIHVIKKFGITYGLKEDVLQTFVDGRIELPVTIAEGNQPISGKDAYLKPLILTEEIDRIDHSNDEHNVDYKNIKEIPSVTKGTTVGIKVERTHEVDGTNVYGEKVKASPGRDFKLRPGKNTRISNEGNEIISLIDGQVSNESKVIHVYPVFEVNGDLDMSIGNIDFVGNVNIRGGVPSGFKITAKGDVRIRGTVESGDIDAGGSVYIHQGVVAQGKGIIRAKGDFHTTFINQGNVEVEGNVHVSQSILHSNIEAQGYVYCNTGRGNIVGGHVSAGKGIEVNEVGNSMSTPTALYLGISKHIIESEKRFKKQLNESQSELEKLKILLSKISEKENGGNLSPQERVLKLRIRNSINETENVILSMQDKLLDLHDVFRNQQTANIKVYKNIYPNSDIHFGKYRRKIISKHQYVMFKLDHSEIKFESLR